MKFKKPSKPSILFSLCFCVHELYVYDGVVLVVESNINLNMQVNKVERWQKKKKLHYRMENTEVPLNKWQLCNTQDETLHWRLAK